MHSFGSSNTTTAPNLTLSELRTLMGAIKAPTWAGFVVTPRTKARLAAEAKTTSSIPPTLAAYQGTDIFVKNNQTIECWAFKDRDLMRRYLNDQITEFDLMARALATPGKPAVVKQSLTTGNTEQGGSSAHVAGSGN